jgi:hypothetical protein
MSRRAKTSTNKQKTNQPTGECNNNNTTSTIDNSASWRKQQQHQPTTSTNNQQISQRAQTPNQPAACHSPATFASKQCHQSSCFEEPTNTTSCKVKNVFMFVAV